MLPARVDAQRVESTVDAAESERSRMVNGNGIDHPDFVSRSGPGPHPIDRCIERLHGAGSF